MSTRFISNVTLGVAGGFLVATSFAFSVPTFQWLSFGIGILAVALSVAAQTTRRGAAQRGLDALTAGLGAWTIVESLVFSTATSTIMWLGFAAGAAFVGLAIAGLTLHELSTERVVHSFEVTGAAPAEERELAGAR